MKLGPVHFKGIYSAIVSAKIMLAGKHCCETGPRLDFHLLCISGGVSWPRGLVHRTQILVLSENQNVGLIPGSGTCVLEQDTSP